MTPRTIGLLLLAAVVGLLLAPPTAPVGVSFLESESMEPTVNTGDGVVLVPSGEVQEGDIVTFRSDHRDEFVTHRVVGETEAGYVTQGDNNDVTDQEAGHPPVSETAVVGQVLTIGDTPLAIPGLGTAAVGIDQHRTGLIALLAIVAVVAGAGGDERRRGPLRVGQLFRMLVVVGFITATVPILVGGSAVGVTLTDATDPDDSETVVLEDGTATVDLDADRPRLMTVGVSANGATVVDREWVDGSLRVTLTRDAVQSGETTATLQLYRYPGVLPIGVLDALQTLHPFVSTAAAVAALFAPIAAVYRIAYAPETPIRDRSRLARKLGGGR